MLPDMRVTREDTTVLFVRCADEPAAIRAAWERLEAIVGSLRGRRFVGAFWPSGDYWACVERLADEQVGDLEAGVVPGGTYLRERLRGEPPGIYDRLPAAFASLEAQALRDIERPGLEHYRRRDVVDVLMPLASAAR
jgi:hypothetical protein